MSELKLILIIILINLYYSLGLQNCQYAHEYKVLHCYNVQINFLKQIQREPEQKLIPTLVSYVTIRDSNVEELTREFITKHLSDVIHLEIHDSLSHWPLEKGMFRKHENLRLQSITIKNTNCSGVGIEKDLWSDNDRLKEIILSNVPIRSLKDQFVVPNLEVLVLDNAGITEIDHLGAFNELRNLRVLHLTNNFIDELTSRTFKKLENLKELSLSGNNIFCLYGTEFSELQSLETLDLSGNPLKFIELNPIVKPLQNIKLVKIHDLPCATVKRLMNQLRFSYQDEETDCVSIPWRNKKCKFVNVKAGDKQYAVSEILARRGPVDGWWQSEYRGVPCIDFMNLFDEYEGDIMGLEQIAGEPVVQQSLTLSSRIENIDVRDLSEEIKDMVAALRESNFKLIKFTRTVANQIPYNQY